MRQNDTEGRTKTDRDSDRKKQPVGKEEEKKGKKTILPRYLNASLTVVRLASVARSVSNRPIFQDVCVNCTLLL